MRYRSIGTDPAPATGREVSVLALGAMLFGPATDGDEIVIATELGAEQPR
ncbi:hypothetical protein [Streptomyces sp. NPDC048428]